MRIELGRIEDVNVQKVIGTLALAIFCNLTRTYAAIELEFG